VGECKSGQRGVNGDANFGDTTLHDQEIWIIDIELGTPDESLGLCAILDTNSPVSPPCCVHVQD